MVARVQPGYAFSVVCDLGSAVGLTTHVTERMGSFVWIASPVFDEQPTQADVAPISAWRWPLWLPLGAMARRKLVVARGSAWHRPGTVQPSVLSDHARRSR